MFTDKNSSEKISFYKLYEAELVLLFITIFWGLTFPLIKITLQFISPIFFNFLRFTITLVLFSIIYRKKLDTKRYKDIKFGMILGIFLFAGFAFQTSGLKYTTASKSAFITGTSLVLIPFVQYFILGTKPKFQNILAVFVVMTGMYILSEVYLSELNFGDLLTFLCAISFAIFVVLLDKYSDKTEENYLIFGQFFSMVVFNLIYMLLSEVIIYKDFYITWNKELGISLLVISLFATFLSFILMTRYQQRTTPLRAGVIYNMESLFAVFFAYLLLNEVLNFNQIIGILVMLLGLAVSEFYPYFKIKFKND